MLVCGVCGAGEWGVPLSEPPQNGANSLHGGGEAGGSGMVMQVAVAAPGFCSQYSGEVSASNKGIDAGLQR